MFEEYQLEVLKCYREMKILEDCPLVFRKPSPAALRDFCVCFKVAQFERKDTQILKEFFGDFSSKEELASLIKVVDVDKFKPVINFMNNRIKHPTSKTVELLAWLINFKGRPFRFDRTFEEFDLATTPKSRIQENERKSLNEGKSLPTRFKSKIRLVVVSLVVITGFYFLVDKTYHEGITPPALLSGNFARNQCMYWDDVSFVSIACDEKMSNKVIIAADFERISHFKKITKPDTLTEKDIGKIWYSKIRNKVEFFSGPGVHPEQNDRHLKPLTLYMLKKYKYTGGM